MCPTGKNESPIQLLNDLDHYLEEAGSRSSIIRLFAATVTVSDGSQVCVNARGTHTLYFGEQQHLQWLHTNLPIYLGSSFHTLVSW